MATPLLTDIFGPYNGCRCSMPSLRGLLVDSFLVGLVEDIYSRGRHFLGLRLTWSGLPPLATHPVPLFRTEQQWQCKHYVDAAALMHLLIPIYHE